MSEFLMASAGFIMATVTAGMIRIVLGPSRVDRMMAAQLAGTGGIAALLLRSASAGGTAAVDVAMILALLSVFAPAAFVLSGAHFKDGGQR